MKVLQKILVYLGLSQKKDPNAPPANLNLKFMHGINRISIFMFLGAVIYLIIRAFLR